MVKKFRIKNKRGLSPVITTVLLIALVVVSTSIVFLWFRGMVEEGVTKFGKNIKLVCDDVDFKAEYNAGTLSVVNNGNIPIYNLNLRISSGGNFETREISEISGVDWPETGLAQGGSFAGNIAGEVGSASEMIVSPILVGTSSSGQKTYICGGQYGKELPV
ncbi:MAG: hypothetical protein PHQ66_02845 [Candidatus Nanoarchaeia archaeon]|nr:hypothetical protein [Candidatus Nanoarchaeia archaeon]MDD5357697.1 hypothetical protein [Candidatus Nanoarchaeia archaeon]MDD5588616.1 hypothetical protein [Candidatus Nanoarchaeia archaeon]